MDQKYVCLMMWKLAFSTDISQKKTLILYNLWKSENLK